MKNLDTELIKAIADIFPRSSMYFPDNRDTKENRRFLLSIAAANAAINITRKKFNHNLSETWVYNTDNNGIPLEPYFTKEEIEYASSQKERLEQSAIASGYVDIAAWEHITPDHNNLN